MEVKRIDTWLRLQTRTLEAASDGAAVPRLQFHIRKPFKRCRHAHVFGSGFS
jgi:hypothetical protein